MSKKKVENQEILDKVTDLESQLKRAVADYHNLERRISEGRSELTSFTNAELVKKMLPVLDHLETALAGVTETEKQSGWVKGVELAVKEFKQVLETEGLDEIEATGQFDPNLHEAVDTREPSSAEASAGKGENSVLEVVKTGYNLNGKVIRPAQVVVGRQQDEQSSPSDKSNEDKQSLPEGKSDESIKEEEN